MLLLLRPLLILTLLFAGATALASEPFRRVVNFEWEPIEGASKYDLELRQTKQNGRTFKFQVGEAVWTGRLAPGNYEMKLRALDYRGVPGDWSEPSPFLVGLEPVQIVSPALNDEVNTGSDDTATVATQWKPVGGATSYKVEVATLDGTYKKSVETKDVSARFDIPVAQKVVWKVAAFGSEGITSDAVTESQFDVIGKSIEKPKIEAPENEFVREVKWSRPEHTKSFDVTVYKLDPAQKKWAKVAEVKGNPDERIAFDPKWAGGHYRVDVLANGDLRRPSEKTTARFKVRGGDRSPAAEFNHEVRKSIDRINGWYGIASYLITMVQHSSVIQDTGFKSSYEAIGGTGRLGVGYFKEEKSWGFLSIVDMSGFINNENKNTTFSSLEVSAVWRKNLGERGEFRSQMGVFQKEYPITIGSQNGGVSSYRYEKGGAMGPHVSGEYWYSMTPKLGLQVNTHLYMNMVKVSTPNGLGMSSTMSTQFGFLGSYRFNRRFTGLMGYARREDNFHYASTVADTNKVTHTGNYLNFFAEYNF